MVVVEQVRVVVTAPSGVMVLSPLKFFNGIFQAPIYWYVHPPCAMSVYVRDQALTSACVHGANPRDQPVVASKSHRRPGGRADDTQRTAGCSKRGS